MKNWDKVYSKNFGGTWYPNEGIIKFAARYLQRRVGLGVYDTKRKISRILDAGCGNGRHLLFFAEQGYEVYGMDISKEAIEIAEAWLAEKNLKANLKVGGLEKLPYGDAFFDAVVSFEVLDHLLFPAAKKAIEEMKRVLLPGGYLFVSLRSVESSECGRGKKISKNTYTLEEGYEKGLIQHYFDLGEIKELLEGFRIFDLELCEQKFPSFYTLDKAFLQSSRGMKKYLNLNEPIDFNLKNSRWFIAAEKN